MLSIDNKDDIRIAKTHTFTDSDVISQQAKSCPHCDHLGSKVSGDPNYSVYKSAFSDAIDITMKIIGVKTLAEEPFTTFDAAMKNLGYVVGGAELVTDKLIRTDFVANISEPITNKTEIRKILLKNTEKGQEFYPDKLAFEFNMDLKNTIEVTRELLSEGYVE